MPPAIYPATGLTPVSPHITPCPLLIPLVDMGTARLLAAGTQLMQLGCFLRTL
jgi:hypothetical protein